MEANLRKKVLLEELHTLSIALRERGFEISEEDYINLEESDLLALRRQLRDTLRTLGGGRQ